MNYPYSFPTMGVPVFLWSYLSLLSLSEPQNFLHAVATG